MPPDAPPYPQLVLEHQRHPRNFGALAGHTHAADGDNALCGDHLRVELVCREGRITAFGFSGDACAIAIASASMLGERAPGLDGAQLAALERRFRAVIAGECAHDGALGDLNAFGELQRHPLRRKCALLAWAAARAALAGASSATTE